MPHQSKFLLLFITGSSTWHGMTNKYRYQPLHYIAKYVSKPEKKTETYKEIMQRACFRLWIPIIFRGVETYQLSIGGRAELVRAGSLLSVLDLSLIRPEDQRATTFVFGNMMTVRRIRSGRDSRHWKSTSDVKRITYLKFLLRFNKLSSRRKIYAGWVLNYEYKHERREQEEDY